MAARNCELPCNPPAIYIPLEDQSFSAQAFRSPDWSIFKSPDPLPGYISRRERAHSSADTSNHWISNNHHLHHHVWTGKRRQSQGEAKDSQFKGWASVPLWWYPPSFSLRKRNNLVDIPPNQILDKRYLFHVRHWEDLSKGSLTPGVLLWGWELVETGDARLARS